MIEFECSDGQVCQSGSGETFKRPGWFSLNRAAGVDLYLHLNEALYVKWSVTSPSLTARLQDRVPPGQLRQVYSHIAAGRTVGMRPTRGELGHHPTECHEKR